LLDFDPRKCFGFLGLLKRSYYRKQNVHKKEQKRWGPLGEMSTSSNEQTISPQHVDQHFGTKGKEIKM